MADFETHPVGTAQVLDDVLDWMQDVEELVNSHFGPHTRREFNRTFANLRVLRRTRHK